MACVQSNNIDLTGCGNFQNILENGFGPVRGLIFSLGT